MIQAGGSFEGGGPCKLVGQASVGWMEPDKSRSHVPGAWPAGPELEGCLCRHKKTYYSYYSNPIVLVLVCWWAWFANGCHLEGAGRSWGSQPFGAALYMRCLSHDTI